MTKHSPDRFGTRYKAALLNFVRHGKPGATDAFDSATGSLGRDAFALGWLPSDVARLHRQTANSFISAGTGRREQNNEKARTRASDFFMAVLVPWEQAHENTTREAGTVSRVTLARAAQVPKLQSLLQREITLRKVAERKVVNGTRNYDQLVERSARQQMRARQLMQRLLFAQEEERKTISRELHDELGQLLAAVNVHLAALNESAAIDRENIRQRVARTQQLIEHSVRIVHRYARELRPAMLDDLGLIPALQSYLKEMPRGQGLHVRFIASPSIEILDNMRRTVLYRVALEALTNVIRHSGAKRVTVELSLVNNTVCLEVRDNGKSFSVARILTSNTTRHLGLIGMRERVEMVGGKFSVVSTPARGTSVRAEIPVQSESKS